jgi:hypothetical protein
MRDAGLSEVRTSATNYFDHDSVGNSNVFFPLTIDGASIRAPEHRVIGSSAPKLTHSEPTR